MASFLGFNIVELFVKALRSLTLVSILLWLTNHEYILHPAPYRFL